MAGVYVRGVKKPYGCTFCPWCRTTCSFCKAANKNISVLEMKGPDWCPLVEVPDHGDLIDAHSLKIRLGQRFCLDNRRVMEIVRETVDTAKVVIPEERSEK